MGLISQPIALMDIANCEAFVQSTIDRAGIECAPGELEELLAEGLAILHELAARYQPQMAGYDRPGRFSGYAAMFLPRRLGDAWHRLHPEHRSVTDPDTGKRAWTYGAPTLSLDGLCESDSAHGQAGDSVLLSAKGISAFCHATQAKLRVPCAATALAAR